MFCVYLCYSQAPNFNFCHLESWSGSSPTSRSEVSVPRSKDGCLLSVHHPALWTVCRRDGYSVDHRKSHSTLVPPQNPLPADLEGYDLLLLWPAYAPDLIASNKRTFHQASGQQLLHLVKSASCWNLLPVRVLRSLCSLSGIQIPRIGQLCFIAVAALPFPIKCSCSP